jgi:hypothetical protein
VALFYLFKSYSCTHLPWEDGRIWWKQLPNPTMCSALPPKLTALSPLPLSFLLAQSLGSSYGPATLFLGLLLTASQSLSLHYALCLTSQEINQCLLQAVPDVNKKAQGSRCFCHLALPSPPGHSLLADLFICPLTYPIFTHSLRPQKMVSEPQWVVSLN